MPSHPDLSARLRLTPRLVSRLAAAALVAVFIGLAVFVVKERLDGRQNEESVQHAQQLSGAYEHARLTISAMESAGYRFLVLRDAGSLAEFEQTLADTKGALDGIVALGGPRDKAFVAMMYRDYLPFILAADDVFKSTLAGQPYSGPVPDSQVAARVRAALDGPARAQAALAAAKRSAYERSQEVDLLVMLALYSVGLVFVLAFLLAARVFGLREANADNELASLRKAALTDSLTELGNRRAFEEEALRQAAVVRRERGVVSLAILDVDEFKEVNDTWGHERGDGLLRAVARCLRKNCRPQDRLFRVGGDEFAILFPATSGADAVGIVDRVRAAVASEFGEDATLSAGIAELEHDAGDDALLRQQADAALYEAKLKGRNLAVLYQDTANRGPLFPAAKVHGLRRLLAEGTLSVHFQPIWDLGSGALFAYEALSRPDPEHGLDGPQQAFEIAERVGRVAELDSLCRARILRASDELPDGASLFINISPYSLVHQSFSAEAFAQQVAAAGLSRDRVVLEVTERSNVAPEVIAHTVRQLRAAGFRVALDDVGAGNNGLEILRKVAVDFVKVDQSVLNAAHAGGTGRAALMAILAFAAEANTLVLAEGIEDRTTLETARAFAHAPAPVGQLIFGVQGYFLGRPAAGFAATSDASTVLAA